MPTSSTSWRPGQSGNPSGKRRRRRVAPLVRLLAEQTGAVDELAAAILQALRTGWLPLAHVDVGTGGEVTGYRLAEFRDWRDLLAFVYPPPADPAEDDEAASVTGADLVEAARRTGLLRKAE